MTSSKTELCAQQCVHADSSHSCATTSQYKQWLLASATHPLWGEPVALALGGRESGGDEKSMSKARWSRSPNAAALLGGLCLLPFVVANAIVANRIEPFFSFIRPGQHTSPFEYLLLATVLAFIVAGGFIAARPLFDRSAPPSLRTYILNGAVGALMLAVFLILSIGLGSEIYRCDILRIPNCD